MYFTGQNILFILHYISPRKIATGDWCFCDGYISFRDIANLYTQHFTGRVLAIVSDCSYSGKWDESCKEFLDKIGVQPSTFCQEERNQIKRLKPDQIGSSLICSARGIGNDKNTVTCYVWPNHAIAEDQTACGDDFTKITCPEEECALVSTFRFQLKKTLPSTLFIVNSTDQGRRGWHIALLVDDPETIHLFKEISQGENTGTQTANVIDYGKAINSGRGQEPSQEVTDWIYRVHNGLETLSL